MKSHKVTFSIETHLTKLENFNFLIESFKNQVNKKINNDVFSSMVIIIATQFTNTEKSKKIRDNLVISKFITNPVLFSNLNEKDLVSYGCTKSAASSCLSFVKWYLSNKEKLTYEKLKQNTLLELKELFSLVKGINEETIRLFSSMCLGNQNISILNEKLLKKSLCWLWNSTNSNDNIHRFKKEASPYLTVSSLLLEQINENNLFIYESYKEYINYYFDNITFFNKKYIIKATNHELVAIYEGSVKKVRANLITTKTKLWLNEYSDGRVREFKCTVRLPFNKKTKTVYETLMNVGYGKTISYLDLANSSGIEKAARRVGTIMKQNKIPFIIPCHRVIKSNGSLGDYLIGTTTKEMLLKHEGV